MGFRGLAAPIKCKYRPPKKGVTALQVSINNISLFNDLVGLEFSGSDQVTTYIIKLERAIAFVV